MYKIDATSWGFNLLFEGDFSESEALAWKNEWLGKVNSKGGKFHVFVDMRNLKPISAEAQKHMVEGQGEARSKGMDRSVVILANPIITMQFKRLAKDSGIYEWERYIDASKVDDWKKVGEDWLLNQVDPD